MAEEQHGRRTAAAPANRKTRGNSGGGHATRSVAQMEDRGGGTGEPCPVCPATAASRIPGSEERGPERRGKRARPGPRRERRKQRVIVGENARPSAPTAVAAAWNPPADGPAPRRDSMAEEQHGRRKLRLPEDARKPWRRTRDAIRRTMEDRGGGTGKPCPVCRQPLPVGFPGSEERGPEGRGKRARPGPRRERRKQRVIVGENARPGAPTAVAAAWNPWPMGRRHAEEVEEVHHHPTRSYRLRGSPASSGSTGGGGPPRRQRRRRGTQPTPQSPGCWQGTRGTDSPSRRRGSAR